MKLTPAQRHGLEWFREWGPVGWFNAEAPNKQTRNRLERSGLIESLPAQSMQVIKYQLTPAARAALAQHKEK